MSGAQQKAAGEQALWQANLSKMLAEVSIPEFQKILGGPDQTGMIPEMFRGMSSSGMLPGDLKILNEASGQLERGYEQAGFGQREAAGYNALRAGEARISPLALNSTFGRMATTLDQQKTQAEANLRMMSAQQNLTDYNKLLGLLGTGTQSALGLAGGFSGAANTALGGMSQMSPWAGAGSGAASGAALGTAIYPGIGTAIGAIAGGAAGYFGSR